MAKILWHEEDPVIIRKISFCICILVKGYQLPILIELLKNGFTMASSAESAVNVDATTIAVEIFDHLAEKDWNMVRERSSFAGGISILTVFVRRLFHSILIVHPLSPSPVEQGC